MSRVVVTGRVAEGDRRRWLVKARPRLTAVARRAGAIGEWWNVGVTAWVGLMSTGCRSALRKGVRCGERAPCLIEASIHDQFLIAERALFERRLSLKIYQITVCVSAIARSIIQPRAES